MKMNIQLLMPNETSQGSCVNCPLAIASNDRVSPEIQPDGSLWPLKPFPQDTVQFKDVAEIYDHLLEHQRAGHVVDVELLEEALQLTRLSEKELAIIRKEFAEDPKGMEYAGKTALEQWHLLNCTLVPFHDELGNRVGYTSRANLLFRKGIRHEDVVMATYNR